MRLQALGPQQIRALELIRARGHITARELADELLLADNRAAAILYVLEVRGLVTRGRPLERSGPGRHPIAWAIAS